MAGNIRDEAAEIVTAVLLQAGVQVSRETVRGWTAGERSDAYDWAVREQHAPDSPRLAEPGCVTRARHL